MVGLNKKIVENALITEGISYVLTRNQKGLITWKSNLLLFIENLLSKKLVDRSYNEIRFNSDDVNIKSIVDDIEDYTSSNDIVPEKLYSFLTL